MQWKKFEKRIEILIEESNNTPIIKIPLLLAYEEVLNALWSASNFDCKITKIVNNLFERILIEKLKEEE